MTWAFAIRGFKSYLTLERSMSEHTLLAYLSDIHKFEQWLSLEKKEIGPLSVTRNEVEHFILWVNNLGLEASSQARLIAGLRAFFKYLMVEDYLNEDPTELLEGPKLSRKLPIVLTIDEVRAIFESIDHSTDQGVRNRAMMELLYACGLRVTELVTLRLHDLHFEEGYIKVLGKNNKERIVPVSEDAVKHILLYVQHVRNHQKNIQNGYESFLFLNRNGKNLSRVMVFLIVKELTEAAGILKNVSPHTFRHTFATHLVEGGADLKAVQDMLGHESITTTEIYTHLDTEYLRETIFLYHPRLKMK